VTSLAECLAEILGSAPPSDGEARDWLAARALGLVPVADPTAFEWPGRFLGRWANGSWCVLFGVPPGVIFGAVEGPEIAEAWIVAEHQPAPVVVAAPSAGGSVRGVYVAGVKEAPMTSLPSARAVPGRGLEGDRYYERAGTFSPGGGTGRDLTLVDLAALEGAGVAPEESRRNVITEGIDHDARIGRSFRIGAVECFGRRRCEPCAHLQRLTRPGVLRALVHRGGLRADVVAGGEICVGDPVVATA
jgi:hypothetical protein